MADRHEELYRTLRDRICLLDYPPGARLSESDLAAEFGTSRTPLRRVLARLEDEGLVRPQHGVGTIVTDAEPQELLEVYALREELAELAARLSPVPVSDAALGRIDGFIERADALRDSPDGRAFARLNMEFFAFGLELTDNGALREVSERLFFRTTRIWLHRVDHLDLAEEIGMFRHELGETRRALRLGDTRAAALIRRAHISMSRQRLLASLAAAP
ncbi:regulatory protein GntR, HTH:GntR, C-terminal [Pseudooceanicola batsensis HTCC2597]|uniref:Regulatory protein GntR, HTH:GntR, C-terminal n=1 Tax=Pseudooceanicola batsensis (strain ATCC BAA-863 / DSM 15984 / KCTC 12145 / HTCC2597) TaxID=252305 RepID=A3TWB5_PSEBH|nr:GntR family transcriptional regulator [Pseudooceanicola batsensis]EAQ03911.1 regulatory protein GntR, HTH:GntR, C-terminal [Pseudooceanicola batsensis HTCC2597]